MKNTITEMKNTLEGINSRLNDSEEQISELEDRAMAITATEQKKMKRNKDSLRDLWNNVKHTSVCIIQVLEEQEREKGPKKIFEDITAENFPNRGKEIVP